MSVFELIISCIRYLAEPPGLESLSLQVAGIFRLQKAVSCGSKNRISSGLMILSSLLQATSASIFEPTIESTLEVADAV